MEERLVDFETAKLAKEKGFDLKTNYFYYNDGVLDQGDGDTEHISLNHNKYDRHYSAPTQYLLQKWLREEKSIYVCIYPLKVSTSTTKGFRWDWTFVFTKEENKETSNINDNFIGFLTYEEALENALKIILKTIVNE